MTTRDELEKAIWGYNDPCGWPDGSFGDEILKLAEKMVDLGADIETVAGLFKPTVKNVHDGIEAFIFGDTEEVDTPSDI